MKRAPPEGGDALAQPSPATRAKVTHEAPRAPAYEPPLPAARERTIPSPDPGAQAACATTDDADVLVVLRPDVMRVYSAYARYRAFYVVMEIGSARSVPTSITVAMRGKARFRDSTETNHRRHTYKEAPFLDEAVWTLKAGTAYCLQQSRGPSFILRNKSCVGIKNGKIFVEIAIKPQGVALLTQTRNLFEMEAHCQFAKSSALHMHLGQLEVLSKMHKVAMERLPSSFTEPYEACKTRFFELRDGLSFMGSDSDSDHARLHSSDSASASTV